MKKLLLTCMTIFTFLNSWSQYNANRYRQRIFASANVQHDVQYGTAPQWVFPYWNEDLFMDIYTPAGDVHNKRPLVIFAHAGGFLNGAKDVDDMVALCDSFARKGYITASIAYRKGFNPLGTGSAERAVYRGIQDGKAAVRFFKEYATTYGIDTNNIFFGGMSAGGYIALHVGYMDKETERPASTFGGGTVNDLGCLDCSGNNYQHTSKIKGVLDYWGAVQDTTIIESGNVPIMIMHGENDPTVPFNYGYPFGLFTLPQTYGGLPISKRAAHVGLDYEFITSQGPLHMLDGSDNGTFTNPPNAFWGDTLLPKTRNFLLHLIKPQPVKLSPETIHLCLNDTASFKVSNSTSSYYDWIYSSQVSTVLNTHISTLKLQFPMAGTYEIAVLEYNQLLCASDTLRFHVVVSPAVVAGFTSAITNNNQVAFSNTSVGGTTYQWTFGDQGTSTAQNPTHTYAANGTYTVKLIVTNAAGCTDTITKTVIIQQLSVAENDLKANIQVYPNPMEDVLFIRSNQSEKISLTVTDLNGKILFESGLQDGNGIHEISTSQWRSGIYFLSVETENGERVIVKIMR